ncbi:MAG TPA: S8 family peptidase [Cyclobacteriaceae bacterium]|nr:S8 family peptidase [Cyclobacteriaceae bacterium]
MAKNSLLLVLIVCAHLSIAQEGRYAVFFADKDGTSFSIDNPLAFLSQKSVDRRMKNGAAISNEDFPVNTSYVAQLKSLGANILYTSRWMNAAIIQLDDGELADILLLPFVSSYEYLGPKVDVSGGRVRKLKDKKDSNLGIINQVQLSMLGLDDMHSEDIYGQGITIAVFDSGFPGVDQADAFKALFDEGRITYTIDMVGNSENVFQYDGHGTEVFSIMAANKAGSFLGGVPKANYQLYVTEEVSTEFRIEEYNWLVAAEKADSAGVDIINSSLGYNLFDDASMDYTKTQLDGNTALVSKAARLAISKGIFVVVSAGNDGNTSWSLVNPPADVDGILAVGSITSTGNLSGFSSIGPTTDGRIKPDVVALGSGVSVIKSNGNTGFTSGTSAATPLITSLVAGLMQTFPELTVSALYDLVIASGNMSNNPDNQKGYGVPNYSGAKLIQLGEEPPEHTSAVYLFPNPSFGNTIKLEMDVPIGQMATIHIYNLQGQLMLRSEGEIDYSNNPIELDVSGIGSGLYFVKVESDGVLRTIRLIKL